MFIQEHLLVLCSHILSGLCQLFLPQPQHPTLYVFDEGFKAESGISATKKQLHQLQLKREF